MKVTLEKGETLDLAVIENDRVIGTISLELRGILLTHGASPAAAPASAGSTAPKKPGKGVRHVSEESRSRMAEAQRRRWAKYHNTKSK